MNKGKRIVRLAGGLGIFLLSLCMSCVMPKTAKALTDGDYEYAVKNDMAMITKYNGNEAELIIPAKLGDKNVGYIDADAFKENGTLECVTFPAKLKHIYKDAFSGCSKLSHIVFGKEISYVTQGAFWNCPKLKYVMIPDSLTDFQSGFNYLASTGKGVEGFTYLYHNESDQITACKSNNINTQQISLDFAFVSGTKGQEIKITGCLDSNSEIQKKNLNIPALIGDMTVLGIGDFAFYNVGMGSVSIDSGVTSIGENAFEFCPYLETVSLPNTIESIGSTAFMDCKSLASITIPGSVTELGEGAFMGCTGLLSVVIPKTGSLTTIKEDTFYGCESLASVTFPSALTSIGSGAFFKCEKLTSISVPSGVLSIGKWAFFGCKTLGSIAFDGTSISSIGKGAFCGCEANHEITILNKTCAIGEYAFGYTEDTTDISESNLENGYGNFEKVSEYEINGYTGSTAETYAQDNDITFIPLESNSEDALQDYQYQILDAYRIKITGLQPASSLKTKKVIRIPKTIVIDGKSRDVTEIGDDVFKDCTSLVRVYLSESMREISLSAFDGCANLEQIDVDENSDYFYTEEGVLYEKNITKLLLYPQAKPESSFEIPRSVSEIEQGAFSGNTKLTNLVIYPILATIGKDAFLGCSGLKTVDYKDTRKAWQTVSIASGNESLTAAKFTFVEEENENPNPENPGEGESGKQQTQTDNTNTTAANTSQDTASTNTTTTQQTKKKQPMTVKTAKKTVKRSKVKSKKQVISGAILVKKNQGKVSYKKVKKGSSSALTINKKTGKITVKKGTKKGTYKIKVKVTAAGNSNYKSGSKTVTVKIQVK